MQKDIRSIVRKVETTALFIFQTLNKVRVTLKVATGRQEQLGHVFPNNDKKNNNKKNFLQLQGNHKKPPGHLGVVIPSAWSVSALRSFHSWTRSKHLHRLTQESPFQSSELPELLQPTPAPSSFTSRKKKRLKLFLS